MDGSSRVTTTRTTTTIPYTSGGTSSTLKSTYTQRPTYTYTPVITTPTDARSMTGRYTPIGSTAVITRQPSPGATSVGRERDVPILREQKITETFKASGRVGPRTDW